MKNVAIILSLALMPFLFSSCEKEDSDSKPDLTKEITGSYTGSLLVENPERTSTIENLEITLTRESNSQVAIEPSGQTTTHTFQADLTEASDGISMEIKEQSVTGGTLYGYTQAGNPEGMHGGVATEETDGENFFYTIKVELSGWTETRIFVGTKIN